MGGGRIAKIQERQAMLLRHCSYDCFLVLKLIFQHYDHCLTKFHAWSEQPLMCVVINNSSYPTVKNNNTAYHAFVKYWMEARASRVSKLSFKILLAESYLLHMSRVVWLPVFDRPYRYFTANLAEARKRPVFWKAVCEAGIVKRKHLP